MDNQSMDNQSMGNQNMDNQSMGKQSMGKDENNNQQAFLYNNHNNPSKTKSGLKNTPQFQQSTTTTPG